MNYKQSSITRGVDPGATAFFVFVSYPSLVPKLSYKKNTVTGIC